ncbi:MAG TPA: S8 family peptidase [Vicinamibacterales bacterium]|nr:S8 family peptidase [Vicinamibacterales bacterium]
MLRRLLFTFALVIATIAPVRGDVPHRDDALDAPLRQRAEAPSGQSRVIVRFDTADDAAAGLGAIDALGGTLGRPLSMLHAQVAQVPDTALDTVAALPGVRSVSLDRPIYGTDEPTNQTIEASWVRDTLGYDGTGVGVAIIDSGVVPWHDDLGPSRVVHFADFVNFQPSPYDDYGHGTHVAGIIAGSGYDSDGLRRGVAPGASLVVLKVLDGTGQGYISTVIAAIDYAIANRDAFHIRVINLSVAAGIYESYATDPLTLAARRAVEAGIVVVTAAGNLGRDKAGDPQYGGIGAPGNAPWVITVGASSSMGTPARGDDAVAAFSSRGPAAIDNTVKPDLVAPGVGIASITDPGTQLYRTKPSARLWGTIPTATEPYLSLSGTSMASPVVTGTIALMLEANPALTPNLVKAILEYTAETKPGDDPLTQGAGFLNARGAVELATSMAFGASIPQSTTGDPTSWSGHLTWGHQRVGRGLLRPDANAFAAGVVWGSALTRGGQPVAWGTVCTTADCAGGPVWTLASPCDPRDPDCGAVTRRDAAATTAPAARTVGGVAPQSTSSGGTR